MSGAEGPQGRKPRRLDGVTGRVTALARQPGGRSLAAGCSEAAVLIWDQKKLPSAVLSVDGPVSCLDWSPDGNELAVGTALGDVMTIWTGQGEPSVRGKQLQSH